MPYTTEQVAARAAYRLGLLDAILHPNVIGALNPAPIVTSSLTGEREHRIRELSECGVDLDTFEDLDLKEER